MIQTLLNSSFLLFFVLLLQSCSDKNSNDSTDSYAWSSIIKKARGTEVVLEASDMNPMVANYLQNYVVKDLKDQYDIDLKISYCDNIAQNQNHLACTDIVWGDGLYLKSIDMQGMLFKAYKGVLPNTRYLDFDLSSNVSQCDCKKNQFPWGNLNLTYIADSSNNTQIPRTMNELRQFVHENPGKYTIGCGISSVLLLRNLMSELAEKDHIDLSDFDDEMYDKYSEIIWEYIDSIKPYFWKNGKMCFSEVGMINSIYDRDIVELEITDEEIANKSSCELSCNSDFTLFLGIVKSSKNRPGAKVVLNHLLSPSVQIKKLIHEEDYIQESILSSSPQKLSDIITILDSKKQNSDDNNKIAVAPEYLVRLYDDLRDNVFE